MKFEDFSFATENNKLRHEGAVIVCRDMIDTLKAEMVKEPYSNSVLSYIDKESMKIFIGLLEDQITQLMSGIDLGLQEVGMNRFQHLIEEARKRAIDIGVSGENLVVAKPSGSEVATTDRQMKLPYSSEPEPIQRPWHTDFSA